MTIGYCLQSGCHSLCTRYRSTFTRWPTSGSSTVWPLVTVFSQDVIPCVLSTGLPLPLPTSESYTVWPLVTVFIQSVIPCVLSTGLPSTGSLLQKVLQYDHWLLSSVKASFLEYSGPTFARAKVHGDLKTAAPWFLGIQWDLHVSKALANVGSQHLCSPPEHLSGFAEIHYYLYNN